MTQLVRFCSANGRQWTVGLHSQAPVAEFLIFESGSERRALFDPPHDWEHRLVELLEQAVRMEDATA